MKGLYLGGVVLSAVGILALNWRLRTGVLAPRLLRSLAMTVALFLAFDVLGSARGWFASSRRLNVLIIPPGIPLEEPVLLAFLALVSISLFRGITLLHQSRR